MKTVKQKKNFRSAFRNFLTIACVMVIGVLSQSCGASASGTDDQDAASQKVWQSTIDDSIQGIAEQELRKLCTDAEPVWATAVVMDVATGDIKALANLERVDSLDASKGYIEKHNYAISCNETSSVMNVISMLVALEDSIVVDVNERITTGSSWAYSSAYPISDAHAYPDLSVTEVISRSSNIGIAKIITAAYGDNPQAFGERLMGLGMTVNSLGAGVMVDKPVMRFTGNENADRILLSRMSYGYGMAVAPIHILAVYNAIANGGQLVTPRLETNGKVGRAKRICSEANAQKLREMMHAVISDVHGTGKSLRNPDVEIAGKTGTAYVAVDGKYTMDKRHSFCGFFPYDNPRYSCIVVCESAKYGATGNCGKVFLGIAKGLCANATLNN